MQMPFPSIIAIPLARNKALNHSRSFISMPSKDLVLSLLYEYRSPLDSCTEVIAHQVHPYPSILPDLSIVQMVVSLIQAKLCKAVIPTSPQAIAVIHLFFVIRLLVSAHLLSCSSSKSSYRPAARDCPTCQQPQLHPHSCCPFHQALEA